MLSSYNSDWAFSKHSINVSFYFQILNTSSLVEAVIPFTVHYHRNF